MSELEYTTPIILDCIIQRLSHAFFRVVLPRPLDVVGVVVIVCDWMALFVLQQLCKFLVCILNVSIYGVDYALPQIVTNFRVPDYERQR